MAFMHKLREKAGPHTFTQHVVDELRELILSGSLREGQQLRQDSLAAALKASGIPVREALRQLEAEGLVTFFPHRGAIVSGLSLDEIREFFDTRALLECDILRRAIPNLTEADFQAAAEVLDFFDDAFDNHDLSAWGQLNWKFHSTLYAAANRPRTLAIIQNLNNDVDRYLRLHLQLTRAVQRAQQDHRKILDLCRKGKVDAACDFLARHILVTGDALIQFLSHHRKVQS
jgi:DNA-binding GntR family transcriptional regulator